MWVKEVGLLMPVSNIPTPQGSGSKGPHSEDLQPIPNIINKYQILPTKFRISCPLEMNICNRSGTAFHILSYHGVYSFQAGDPVFYRVII